MSHDHTQAGAPPVRASDAERDQAGEIIRASYAEGRLGRGELDERLAAAYAAKTRANLRRRQPAKQISARGPRTRGRTMRYALAAGSVRR